MVRRLLPLIALATACSPITPYRTSVGIPTVAPTTSVGAPIPGGEIGLSGYLAGSALGPGNLSPDVGDPGLYAAPLSMGGQARFGLAGAVELGVAGEYASGDAMQQGAAGVLEIPGDDSVWGLGLSATGGYMWGNVGFGATVEATRMSLPYARFEYVGPEKYLHDGVYFGDNPDSLYSLYERGRVNPIRVRSTGAFQFRKDGLEIAGGLSWCPVFTNNGFSIEEVPIYKSGGVAVGPVLDAGYNFGVVRLGAQGWYLMGSRTPTKGFDDGFGARVTAELRPLGAKHEEPVHHPAP